MREEKSLVENNLYGKYKAIKEDIENATHRYYLQSLNCKNIFLDILNLS